MTYSNLGVEPNACMASLSAASLSDSYRPMLAAISHTLSSKEGRHQHVVHAWCQQFLLAPYVAHVFMQGVT